MGGGTVCELHPQQARNSGSASRDLTAAPRYAINRPPREQ